MLPERKETVSEQRVRVVRACLARGAGLPEAAEQLGLTQSGLRYWLSEHEPELYAGLARSYRRAADWPPEALARLKQLHSKGWSAASTAGALNTEFNLDVTKATVTFRAETEGLGPFGGIRRRASPTKGRSGADWSEPVQARLLELELTGHSYAEIARTLNKEFGTSFSRNAVCGRLHRTGNARPELRKTNQLKPPPRKAKATQLRASAAAEPVGVAFLELKPGQCRWPLSIDEGGSAALVRPLAEEKWCGAPANGCYCPAHKAAAHVAETRTYRSEAAIARAEAQSRRMKRYWESRRRSAGSYA